MRRTKWGGSLLLCLLINLLLNLEWSIPALILLGLHFWLDISLWWFVAALSLWVLSVLTGTWFMGWASRVGGEPTAHRENKNPYSVRNVKGDKT